MTEHSSTGSAEWGRLNAAFHRALALYPDSHHALHFLWNNTIAGTRILAQQQPDSWRDDPSADERWNAGCDFAMEQLCAFLGVDPHMVSWDAATETVDGDVCAVIGNILRDVS